jgi:hypothetical protein
MTAVAKTTNRMPARAIQAAAGVGEARSTEDAANHRRGKEP